MDSIATTTLETTLHKKQSVSKTQWLIRSADARDVLTLIQKCDIPEMIARILINRGIDLEKVHDFLQPTLKTSLPDPLHLLDMEAAATRLADAIDNQEQIVIFGDYDVDGATSSALLKRYLCMLNVDARTYIPDRLLEGYGLNSEALLELKKQGADIVVTVDCGTVSHEPIKTANEVGLEIIVIDHHLGGEVLPEAVAVVNPNRLDETSEHTYLAAVGMAFLLTIALNKILRDRGYFNERKEPNLLSLLDLVALGTVCDVVPLVHVNRAFVSQGLKVLAQRGNIGLAKLADIAGLDQCPQTYHLGFVLGPRINAGGRVGKAELGTRLLATNDPQEAEIIAHELDVFNKERQAIEQLVLDEALIQAEAVSPEAAFICVGDEGWHPGVIGIVAGRLKDMYRKPAAVIAWENGIGKASARSISGVDLGSAITEARMKGLLVAGGGHAMAAGFTIEQKKYQEFCDFIDLNVQEKVRKSRKEHVLELDAVLNLSAVTPELASALEQLGPYGVGNPEPRFAIANAKMIKADIVGQSHVRCIFGDGGVGSNPTSKLNAIAFRSVDKPLGQALLNANYNSNLHLAGKIKCDRWQGMERAQLIIEDVIMN